MSAPPLVDPPTMPTMVSRLPKFSSRPKPATQMGQAATAAAAAASSTRLTNGFYHHPGPAGVKAQSSVKHNGFIRVPTSYSVKWKRQNGLMEDADAEHKAGRYGNNIHHYYHPRQQEPPQKPGKTPGSSSRTLPGSKTGSKLSQITSGLTNGTKLALNGLSGSKKQNGTGGSGRPLQTPPRSKGSGPDSGPGSRSGSPLEKKPAASRSHSSDSLGSAPPTPLSRTNKARSRSLTQVQRQPSPTLSPTSSTISPASSPTATHSYSTNRAAERGLTQAPPRSSSGAKIPAPLGRSSLLPSSALKKSLLPGFSPASKPSGISYKLSRPSLFKQSRPLRVTATGGDLKAEHPTDRRDSVETPSTTEDSPGSSPEAPELGGLSARPQSQGEVSIIGETLEDMSLSSTSSLDPNDTSQEYMDDFDNLGNGGVGVLLMSCKNDEDDSGLDQSCARFDEDKEAVNSVSKATELCFLDDGLDWTGMRLSGDRGDHRLSRLSRPRRSSQPEYHEQGGSSLDLSPSDSCGSGGTYMWDEEGLEPLGGAANSASISTNTNGNTTHHIGSFDSDLNSIDILNHLESTCDLDEDDLMLDVDFPEDTSVHSDGDAMSHMAQWRRRQLCWGTQDIHDADSEFRNYKLTEDPGNQRKETQLILDLCPPGSPGLGVDVEDLAEDFSAVRCQLEYLHRLLLQDEEVDDDTLTTDTLSPETADSSHSSAPQVQTLLQEVQQLRDELRSRDRTIAQLMQQLTVPVVTTRCRCQETTTMDQHTQTSVTARESVGSQTPWRDNTTPPPVPFLSPPWQYQRSRPYRVRPKPSIPSHLARKISDSSPLQPRPEPTDAPGPGPSPSSSSSRSPAPEASGPQ
ncbi:serine-rich coiled-coil domain-containing protein 2-like isoform X2 [Sphaeramia orbicularis]|uniref:serine-rich coiled-coil domain-containing protein 2-like isoform X2 n=1 Tax=Sphaeramia orbicularis TaxID=375764 RepID=UPI00117CC982|nr:serine-rich coiled-coil domain-containing protein 2-like isoform X2 [Sphaeramia orbicularis]